MCVASATLAIWTSAWLGGRAASDDVLDALRVWSDEQSVVAGSGSAAQRLRIPTGPPAPMADLLAGLRGAGARAASLALPVPGDVRRIAGDALARAVESGEAAVFGDIEIAVVPVRAETALRWTAYEMSAAAPVAPIGLGEAEHALSEAVRTSASTLAALDVAGDRPDAHSAVRQRLRAIPRLTWPDGTPGRALRVMQRVEEIAAILALAEADDPGGALSARSASHRSEALRPLAAAVRDARLAVVDEAVRVLAAGADGPSGRR